MGGQHPSGLARSSLAHLQNAFVKLSEAHTPILCVLVQTTIPCPPLEDHRLPPKYERMGVVSATSGRCRPAVAAGSGETARLIRAGFVRRLLVLGQQTPEELAIGHMYFKLAAAAGLAMKGFTEYTQRAFWSDSESGDDLPNSSENWTEGLFDLGWRKIPGLPYHCNRKVWHENVTADVVIASRFEVPGIPEPYCSHRWFSVLDDAIQSSIAAIDYLLLAAAVETDEPPKTAAKKRDGKKAVRDKSLEARDAWIYKECCKGTAYDAIVIQLKKKPANWPRIESKQGIQNAAKRYAERNNLPPIPRRQE
jgi:hypothetical protein